MSAKFDKVKFCEERVKMMRRNVSLFYNAHRDASDELCEAERELRVARRG